MRKQKYKICYKHGLLLLAMSLSFQLKALKARKIVSGVDLSRLSS